MSSHQVVLIVLVDFVNHRAVESMVDYTVSFLEVVELVDQPFYRLLVVSWVNLLYHFIRELTVLFEHFLEVLPHVGIRAEEYIYIGVLREGFFNNKFNI